MSTQENTSSRHFKCGKCNFSTAGGALHLAKHLKEAHYKVDKNKCPHCHYSSQTLGKMVFHIKNNHGIKDVPIGEPKHLEEFKFEIPGSEDNSNQSVDEQPAHEESQETGNYNCDRCGKVFQKAWILLNHMACVHGINYQKSEHDQRQTGDYDYVIPGQTHAVKNVSIKPAVTKNVSIKYSSSALEVFKSSIEKSGQDQDQVSEPMMVRETGHKRKANLQRHLKADMEEKEHKCKQCAYETNYKEHLRAHVTSIHEKMKNRLCDHCGSRFRDQSTLKSHLKAAHHMGEKHLCDQCPYETYLLWHLKRHVKRMHEKMDNNHKPIR